MQESALVKERGRRNGNRSRRDDWVGNPDIHPNSGE